jgi:hypothetical protein
MTVSRGCTGYVTLPKLKVTFTSALHGTIQSGLPWLFENWALGMFS